MSSMNYVFVWILWICLCHLWILNSVICDLPLWSENSIYGSAFVNFEFCDLWSAFVICDLNSEFWILYMCYLNSVWSVICLCDLKFQRFMYLWKFCVIYVLCSVITENSCMPWSKDALKILVLINILDMGTRTFFFSNASWTIYWMTMIHKMENMLN